MGSILQDLLDTIITSFVAPLLDGLNIAIDDHGSATNLHTVHFNFGIFYPMMDLSLYDTLLIVFTLVVIVMILSFFYKFIKWLFSIPKKLGGKF